MIELTQDQRAILEAEGPILVAGGPGSGKTTVSILKGVRLARQHLRAGQRVLFLSFARATVSRVIEAIDEAGNITPEESRLIEVDTYHSFFWRVLRTHGYLLGLPRQLSILTPQAEAVALSDTRNQYPGKPKLSGADKAEKRAHEDQVRSSLATEQGRVCFDLFAPMVGDILESSEKIRCLLADRFPFIILDEFQDTNSDQWRVVRAIGRNATLIALADPEQRIYDFIGADPERLDHFRSAFSPTEFDLSDANHRSPRTEIAIFGDDVLAGKFRQNSYRGIERATFPSYNNGAFTALVTTTLQGRARLARSGTPDWSLAVLVPTKKMTRLVSEAFLNPVGGLPVIAHTAFLELESAMLAAELIACLLEPQVPPDIGQVVALLCAFYRGRGGADPSRSDLKTASQIETSHQRLRACQQAGKPLPANAILTKTQAVLEAAKTLELSGDPDTDWLAVRAVLDNGQCRRLQRVAQDVRNLRMLGRGTQLRAALSEDWRENGCYQNALAITRAAFVREHFASSRRPETGVVVMNMHKAKGKQFDEVVIFEGWPRRADGEIVSNPDRIVWGNDPKRKDVSTLQNLRVSVTRAKQRTTILTPCDDPCVALPS
ncbi:MAG: AAA family ATPase [Thiotrichales bacterium SG8_50]|nr:MAG: AAA family ATPase [Thiotrichales bacterium SG8_50]